MTGDPRCAVGVPNVGPFGDPRLLVELAVAAEEHGWDGFFVWDHLLYHDQRWDVADPLAVIAAVAARTARIRIGVLVNVLARRRIGEVARESVTVDLLSGGRLVVGAGLGSLAAEFTAFGESADARQRAARLDESLGLLDALWSGEPVTVRGQYLTAVDVRMLPRPVQRPRIPVWCGGRWPNRAPFRRAARWDGVMPTHAGYGLGQTMPPEELRAVVEYTLRHRTGDGWTRRPTSAVCEVLRELSRQARRRRASRTTEISAPAWCVSKTASHSRRYRWSIEKPGSLRPATTNALVL